MSTSPLTILVSTVNAVGHATACAGAARPLLARGHRVVILLEASMKGRFAPLGFTEHIYQGPSKGPSEVNPGEKLAVTMVKTKLVGPETPYEKMVNLIKYFESEDIIANMTCLNGALVEAIQLYKPDCILYDANCFMPAIYYSAIPWVKNISMTPLFYVPPEGNLPPGGSGLPLADPNSWIEWTDVRRQFFISPGFNDLVEKLGYPRYPNDERNPNTQSLTVYGYPDELDYPEIQSLGWFNLEVFNKPEVKDVSLEKLVPAEFLADSLDGKFSGKWIYLSMGSMGSIDLKLMNRLIEVLGTTAHKYLVSKGPRHREYSLPRNMFGERFLSQMSLLPHVDLVITHGGNNTVTETFALGKPMIVLPLFADQFDNAQRLEETGFGSRIDPNNFTEEELTGKIDRLLKDDHLKSKLKSASKRIQSSKKHEELADKIEEICKEKANS